jgi:hypothetical protein
MNGRTVDEEFNNEIIYRRFKASADKSEWLNNSQLSSSIFQVNSDSCNRSKYSEFPEDVLFNIRIEDNGAHYFSWGILAFNSEIIDSFSFLLNGTKRTFSMKLDHTPLDCMFPHSEIIVLEGEEKININIPPKSARVVIRDYLISNCEIIKSPS